MTQLFNDTTNHCLHSPFYTPGRISTGAHSPRSIVSKIQATSSSRGQLKKLKGRTAVAPPNNSKRYFIAFYLDVKTAAVSHIFLGEALNDPTPDRDARRLEGQQVDSGCSTTNFLFLVELLVWESGNLTSLLAYNFSF